MGYVSKVAALVMACTFLGCASQGENQGSSDRYVEPREEPSQTTPSTDPGASRVRAPGVFDRELAMGVRPCEGNPRAGSMQHRFHARPNSRNVARPHEGMSVCVFCGALQFNDTPVGRRNQKLYEQGQWP